VTSDHKFVLSDQDGVLVGHMSFQVKNYLQSCRQYEQEFPNYKQQGDESPQHNLVAGKDQAYQAK